MKRWLYSIFAVVVLLFARVSAQELTPTPTPSPTPEPEPIIRGAIVPSSVFWSSDSQTLFFDDVSGLPPTEHFQYQVMSGQLTRVALPSLMRWLVPEEQEHFRAWNKPVYLSPDGSSFVYESRFDTLAAGGYARLFAVGNVYSDTFLPLRQTALGDFRVRWSDDGTAFVIESDSGGLTSIVHVRSRDNCFDLFCQFDERVVGELDAGNAIFDLSWNGREVLFRGYWGLVLWDSTQDREAEYGEPDGLFIDFGNIIGAAFIPDDPDRILLVNEAGLLRYTLSTAEFEIINPDINSNSASWVVFSPDNRMAAVLVGANVGREQLYVVRVG
jgi:hypothetical protein